MKKILSLITVIAFLCACGNTGNQKDQPEEEVTISDVVSSLTDEEIKAGTFDELFTPIKETEISESVFKLVGSDFSVITAGTPGDYNSMVASWGGWGILFNKPTAWCFLRANRHTLTYMKKEQTYTFAYFDDPYKEKIMIFGTKSGKDTDKMKEHEFTAVQTPLGGISYKEAKLIIECKLTEITTVSPDDYFSEEGRNFVKEGYEDAKDYHKLVFGEIQGVWVKK